MEVNKPSQNLGELITVYTGKNKKIKNGFERMKFQHIHLEDEVAVSDNHTERCAFEMECLGVKYLIALGGKEVYEVVEETNEKQYLPSLSSMMYMTKCELTNGKMLIKGKMGIDKVYNENAEFFETFKFQLVFPQATEEIVAIFDKTFKRN